MHRELGGHRLHLFLLLAQVRLVDRQLLGDLGPRLPRQYRLELDVELLLLLDQLILRRHLLGLADQRLLQRVRPLDHRVGGGVRPLELAPAVDVHLLVELLRERAHLRALVEHLTVELERLVAEQVDVLDARLEDGELGAEGGDVDVERLDVLDALGVRALPRVQCGLLHL